MASEEGKEDEENKEEKTVLLPVEIGEEEGKRKDEGRKKERGGMTSTPAEGGGGNLRFNFEMKMEEGVIGSPALSPVSIDTKSMSSGEASAEEEEGSSGNGGTAPYTPSESQSPDEVKPKEEKGATRSSTTPTSSPTSSLTSSQIKSKEETEETGSSRTTTSSSTGSSTSSRTATADTETGSAEGGKEGEEAKEEISSTQEGGEEEEGLTEYSDTEEEDEIFRAGESLRHVIEEVRKGHGKVEDGDEEPKLKAEAAIKVAMARERREQERRGADSGFGMADEMEREWREHGIQHFEANKIGELLDADAEEWRRGKLARKEDREAHIKKFKETLEVVGRGRRAMRMWGGWLDGMKKPDGQEGAKGFNESVELVKTALNSAGDALEEVETQMGNNTEDMKRKGGETGEEKKLDESLKLWERGRKRSVAMVLEPHMRDLLRETEEGREEEERAAESSEGEDDVKIKSERGVDGTKQEDQEESSEGEEGFKTGDERMDVDEEEENGK